MYDDIRNSIQSGDIFFTYSDDVLSRLIRFFTRSSVSHVGLFIATGGRVFTVESIQGKGCVMTLASVRLKNKDFIVKEGHSLMEEDIENILGDVGRVKYDWWGAAVSLFIDTKSSRQFCSEWVAQKLKLDFSFLRRGVTPVDILTMFS